MARTGDYIRAQAQAAYDGMALSEDQLWPYCMTTREAVVTVAALRAYADRPGGSVDIADSMYAELQRHIRATLGQPEDPT